MAQKWPKKPNAKSAKSSRVVILTSKRAKTWSSRVALVRKRVVLRAPLTSAVLGVVPASHPAPGPGAAATAALPRRLLLQPRAHEVRVVPLVRPGPPRPHRRAAHRPGTAGTTRRGRTRGGSRSLGVLLLPFFAAALGCELVKFVILLLLVLLLLIIIIIILGSLGILRRRAAVESRDRRHRRNLRLWVIFAVVLDVGSAENLLHLLVAPLYSTEPIAAFVIVVVVVVVVELRIIVLVVVVFVVVVAAAAAVLLGLLSGLILLEFLRLLLRETAGSQGDVE